MLRGMREMEGNCFELGMGMAAMDVGTKNDAILEASSKAKINEEVLTRQVKLKGQAKAAGDERNVGAREATEKQSTPDIGTKPRTSLSCQSMLSFTVFNWITGFVACLFVLSFLSYVHNARYQMVTYVHGLFTENTCNRVSWIWICKPQSDATRTAGNVHIAAQAVMGGWLLIATFLGVCVTLGPTTNFTSNLPVKNIDGTMTTITLEGVYYDPTAKYNLVSVADLASLNFESRFGRHQSSVHGPVRMHVPLIHTCNVYASDAASNSNHFDFASLSKMTNEEKVHLHCCQRPPSMLPQTSEEVKKG